MSTQNKKTYSTQKQTTKDPHIDVQSGQVGIFQFSFGRETASRTSIINHLIQQNKYQSYLEIGVRDGSNFNQVNIKLKVSVDPAPTSSANFNMTSDVFFNSIDQTSKFDLIFIDGLHLHKQVTRDLHNSLNHLSLNGTIVMHDCNPPTAFHQRSVYEVNGEFPTWNGTVWKAWVEARCNHPNLSMAVVNTDWGVGVIQRGQQILYAINAHEINYEKFNSDRDKILNLISVEEFIEQY